MANSSNSRRHGIHVWTVALTPSRAQLRNVTLREEQRVAGLHSQCDICGILKNHMNCAAVYLYWALALWKMYFKAMNGHDDAKAHGSHAMGRGREGEKQGVESPQRGSNTDLGTG